MRLAYPALQMRSSVLRQEEKANVSVIARDVVRASEMLSSEVITIKKPILDMEPYFI